MCTHACIYTYFPHTRNLRRFRLFGPVEIDKKDRRNSDLWAEHRERWKPKYYKGLQVTGGKKVDHRMELLKSRVGTCVGIGILSIGLLSIGTFDKFLFYFSIRTFEYIVPLRASNIGLHLSLPLESTALGR